MARTLVHLLGQAINGARCKTGSNGTCVTRARRHRLKGTSGGQFLTRGWALGEASEDKITLPHHLGTTVTED